MSPVSAVAALLLCALPSSLSSRLSAGSACLQLQNEYANQSQLSGVWVRGRERRVVVWAGAGQCGPGQGAPGRAGPGVGGPDLGGPGHARAALLAAAARALGLRNVRLLRDTCPLHDDVVLRSAPPAPASLAAVPAADVELLRLHAPPLLRLWQRFAPDEQHLAAVQRLRAAAALDAEEAACAWAARDPGPLRSWLGAGLGRPLSYEVAVFACDHDPDLREYDRAAGQILGLIEATGDPPPFALRVRRFAFPCDDEYSLTRKLLERARSAHWPRLAGAVAAVVGGERAASEAARALGAALVLCSPPPAGAAALSATGRPRQLAAAVARFLAANGWRRVGVVSEPSPAAAELAGALRAERGAALLETTTAAGARAALATLAGAGARVVLVNAAAAGAERVLCEARAAGMLADERYVWVTREWRARPLRCANETAPEPLVHFTVSFARLGVEPRRARGAAGPAAAALAELWPARGWPPLAAHVADALLVLVHGFRRYFETLPRRRYDIHPEDFSRTIQSLLRDDGPQGVTQTLRLERGALAEPTVFAYRWHGHRPRLHAAWRLDRGGRARPLYSAPAAPLPPDGAARCVIATGGAFAPVCHDGVALAAAAAAALLVPAALLARRAGRRARARRAAALAARLLARRDRALAALAGRLVPRAAVALGARVGAGHSGVVRRAVLRAPGRRPRVVAAKAPREDADERAERRFLREAVALAALRHAHVVRLAGVCAADGPPLVLTEYAFFGDLRGYLRAARRGAGAEAARAQPAELTRLGREAAAALEYLAARRLVHRDVRAANCLVDERRALRLADFGLARAQGAAPGRGDELPAAWTAPEGLERGEFTAASDAWSLGVLLLELLTLGAPPYGGWPPQRVLRHVRAGGSPPLPAGLQPVTRALLLRCWRRAASERPSAADVRRLLTRRPAQLAAVDADGRRRSIICSASYNTCTSK